MEPKLITLNLIYDYPVRWSKYKVLRDLIQNFYDSVTHQDWHKRFSYCRVGEGVRFEAQNVRFSYDWLIHIGASTKREKLGEYAGYFGEGFKIAALCALRDHGWQRKIIKDEGASWRGMATCIPLKNPITVSAQMPIRYHLAHIALKRSLLLSDDFGAVLSTYLHEVAHMFGPEGSASFSKALTALLEITLCNARLIEYYHGQWHGLTPSK